MQTRSPAMCPTPSPCHFLAIVDRLRSHFLRLSNRVDAAPRHKVPALALKGAHGSLLAAEFSLWTRRELQASQYSIGPAMQPAGTAPTKLRSRMRRWRRGLMRA